MHAPFFVLAEGFADLKAAKTARSLLHYRAADIPAVIAADHAGQSAQAVFGCGGSIPIVSSVSAARAVGSARALFLGTAPPGGNLPPQWRTHIRDALRVGLHIVSGLHAFLADDPEFAPMAAQSGAQLIDLRRCDFKSLPTRTGLRPDCLRVHTVGTDCNLGKMVTAIELTRALKERARDAVFVATGQTGMMLADNGLPIDAVVADFVSGAAEHLVLQHQRPQRICVFEGQGSLTQPLFSAVTLGLLHGLQPHALILCHEPGRIVHRHTNVPIPPLADVIDLYQRIASVVHPAKVIGIALNSSNLPSEQAFATLKQQLTAQLGLPVCDVLRERSAAPLADAVEALIRCEMSG